jgi:hypothetical protein
MPLRNRVLPTGEIVAVPERGTRMGNRGVIHGAGQRLRPRHWVPNTPWIVCLLEWRSINRVARYGQLMAPGKYTELFFLDEATALAAGHRPCGECSRERHREFKAAWAKAAGRDVRLAELDRELHVARIDADGRQRTFVAPVHALPDDAIVRVDDASLWLLRDGQGRRWSAGGYREARTLEGPVEVLTPRPTVEALRHGYRPQVHPTAE